jgi:4'-phosphopantetheinyl transferase
LQSLPLEQRETAFFTCWTRKEAYIKAQGLGLSMPLDSFDVSLAPHEPALLRATRPDPQEASRWTLLALDIDPSYQAAVAAEGQRLEFRFWDWHAPASSGKREHAGAKRIAV